MTVVVDPPDRLARPRRTTTLVVGAVLALVIGWAAVLGLRWWNHPDLLPDHGDGMNADPKPVSRAALAAAVTFPGTDGHSTTLTLHGARAVLATDTARSRVSLVVCHARTTTDIIGYVAGDLSAYCSEVRPIVDGTQLTYPSPDEYVVAVVRPTRPGTTHLVRVDFDYSLGASHLFRHGTDSVAMDLRTHAR